MFYFYVVVSYLDFGLGYFCNNNIMNLVNGLVGGFIMVSGLGIFYLMIGIGFIVYGQVGFKFCDYLFFENGLLMFYLIFQYLDLQVLKNFMMVFEVGINWLIYGNYIGKVMLLV